RRFLALVEIGREAEARARAGLTVGARHADRDSREVGIGRDERGVLAGAWLMNLELQRVERARRRGDRHLLRDGRTAERQRHERVPGIVLFAVEWDRESGVGCSASATCLCTAMMECIEGSD